MGAHVHVEDGALEVVSAVLFGDDRLLDGVHAADRGAIGIVAAVHVPGTHALKPGDFFGFLVVGQAYQVPFRGSGGRQDALHFNGGDNVGQAGVAVVVELRWIKGLESGGEDDGADVQGFGLFLLVKIHRVGRAEFFAGAALAVLEIDAVVMIDGIFQGNGLGIFHIGGLAFDKTGVVGVNDLFGALFSTIPAGNAFGFINISGALNKLHLKGACFAPDLFYFAQRF